MIVETYYFRGIKVNIDDSAYRDKTPEELAAVRRNIEETARQICQAVERRKVNAAEGGRGSRCALPDGVRCRDGAPHRAFK